jgi:CHAT domain-containing protein/Flp pilus assembly protein TadD
VFDHAWNAFQHGDLGRAEQEANGGYSDYRSLGPDWAWKFAILKARILYQKGRSEDVLLVLSSEATVPPTEELVLQKSRFAGLAFASLHRFPEAEQEFDKADKLCHASNYPPCADVVAARGMMEMARGNFTRAQTLFEQVLTSARASGDKVWEAETLLNLSWAADEQGHYDQALDWADAAGRTASSKGVADVAQTAFGNSGWAYYKLGDGERAREMFIESSKEAERLGDTAGQARWLQALGYVYLDAQRFEDARASYQRSLVLAREIKSREHIINSLIALAFVSEQTGKLAEAKRYADEALSMARADGNKRDETYPRLVQGRIAALRHEPVTAEAAFREVAQAPDSPVFLKWEAERSLARLFEDENQAPAAEREYQVALSTFEQARSGLRQMSSRLPFLTNASGIYDDYIHFLVARGRTEEALQVADYSRARTLREGLGLLAQQSSFKPDAVNAAQVARHVGGTIFFYWLGQKQSYLWAISPQKAKLFTLPTQAELEAQVQRYRKALLGPQDVLETRNPDGDALYRALVLPAKDFIPPSGSVFIIPDGSLNAVNFETLLVLDPKPHYLLEDATIINASSLRLLAASHGAGQTHAANLLLFGDAVSANPDYPPLPKASDEVQSIAQHFASASQKTYTQAAANPSAYLASKPEQYAYIHFVAHGTASRLSPLDSAIVLSKATAQDDSFKLYAREILTHPLHAELVTISTCYGAGARAYSGEGLVGLSWAFLHAGAHNVIGALWEVSDVSTPQLMDRLYDELQKGSPPATALRSAKLSLLNSRSAFRKPFYWAPFQLYAGS